MSKVKALPGRTEVKSHAVVAQLRYAGRGNGLNPALEKTPEPPRGRLHLFLTV